MGEGVVSLLLYNYEKLCGAKKYSTWKKRDKSSSLVIFNEWMIAEILQDASAIT